MGWKGGGVTNTIGMKNHYDLLEYRITDRYHHNSLSLGGTIDPSTISGTISGGL